MFNVAVIKFKDLIKYLLTLVVIMCIIYIINRYFFCDEKIKFNKINLLQKISNNLNNLNNYSTYPINLEMPIVKKINNEILIDENNENADSEFYAAILGSEFTIMNIDIANINQEVQENNQEVEEQVEEKNIEKNEEQVEEKDIEKNEEKIEETKTDVKTEVVTENPLADKYTDKHNGVKIKNETSFELTDDILDTNGLNINKSNILIFHTHTCESYTSSEKYSYEPTGNFRTTDLNYTVARVGDELDNYLSNYGYDVTHDKTYHDYPKYNGSYTRSFSTVSKLLENKQSDIIIDLHRDAIGSYSSYAPTVKIGDEYCAQIMFVMGTNGGGLNHPNWQSNLKFAIKIQEEANKIYPGLFKPIILRNSRYNQNLGKAACIIEVGSTGNTLEQCLNSMKYLSKIINIALPLNE